ncbi:hypothetical protein GCM10023221_20400 [Luteimicrobium xylanilyticum]
MIGSSRHQQGDTLAQWEDDLRAVVEHRGAALVEHARMLLEPAEDDGPDRAVELTVRALEAAFRRGGRRTTGEHGSVRLVDDDELDALAARVTGAQDRLAPAGRPPATATPAPPPDDGASEALTARVPEVVAHVRAARSRGRRRALVGSAAVVVVAALATTAFAARPWDRSPTPAPSPTATPYAGACGSNLPKGKSALRVRYDRTWADESEIVADQTWDAAFEADGDVNAAVRGTLDSLTPEVVLTRDGKVVALGVDVPGSATAGDPPASFSDLVAGSPAYVAVRFAACDGGALAPGRYQAHLFATDGSAHVLSGAAGLTVLSTVPEGDQPAWLAGSPLACGEKADEFVVRAGALAPERIDQAGGAVYDDGFAVLLRNGSRRARTLELPRRAVVAWVQHGRIVGVGPDERATHTVTVGKGKLVRVAARPWDTTDYCTGSADGTKPGHLPPGTYQALVYTRVPATDASDPDRWVVDDWRGNDIVIRRDGTAALR